MSMHWRMGDPCVCCLDQWLACASFLLVVLHCDFVLAAGLAQKLGPTGMLEAKGYFRLVRAHH